MESRNDERGSKARTWHVLVQLLDLFKNRNYHFFFVGEVTYRSGIWIAYVTISFLVVEYKGNAPLYLGLIGLACHLPLGLFSLIGGVIADRVDRIQILRISQILFLVPSSLLLIAIFTHHQSYWLAFCNAFLYGTAMSLNNPALYAAVKDVVTDPKQVSSAVSLSTIAVRVTQFLANGLGGLLFAYIAGVGCLLIDFLTHIVSLFFFIQVKNVKSQLSTEKHHPWYDFVEGMSYIKQNFSLSIFMICGTLLLQQLSVAEKRGRVMGVFTLAALGTVPLGSVLYYGLIAKYFGENIAFTGSALIFSIVLIVFIIIKSKLCRYAAPLLKVNQIVATELEAMRL